MYQQQVNVINNFRMVIDAAAVVAAGYSAYFLMLYFLGGAWQVGIDIFLMAVMGVMFINNYVMGRFGLYDDRKHDMSMATLWNIVKALFVSFALTTLLIAFFCDLHAARNFLGLFGGFAFVYILVERFLILVWLKKAVNSGFNRRQILIVGHKKRRAEVAGHLNRQLSWGHAIAGFIGVNEADDRDCLGQIEDLPQFLRTHSIDDVVFALDIASGINLDTYLNVCRRMGISVKIVPSRWDPLEKNVRIEDLQGIPMLAFYSGSFNATGLLYKRLLDIVGGLVGLIVLLIILPPIALAIKIDSPGPVFFRQKRAGMNGRIFGLYKFRTMYVDAEERKKGLMAQNKMRGLMFKMDDDPRVTRVGRFLRETSLDEFPQFINVLKGEISLVGTRPPTLDEVEKYEDWHHRRISAKPGITGLWQISGRSQITDFDEVVRLDCEYLDNWRFLDDLMILWKTVLVVIRGRGAL